MKTPVSQNPQTVDKTGANKGKKKQILFTDPIHNQVVDVDSNEEWYTYAWVVELQQMGLIKDFEYQPECFPLSPKFVYTPYTAPGMKPAKEKFLFHPHIYTADFKLTTDVASFRDFEGPKMSYGPEPLWDEPFLKSSGMSLS